MALAALQMLKDKVVNICTSITKYIGIYFVNDFKIGVKSRVLFETVCACKKYRKWIMGVLLCQMLTKTSF